MRQEVYSRSLWWHLGPVLIALLIVAADRVTKILIQTRITLLDTISVIPGWLRIIHTENPGAAFGVLADGNRWLRTGILIGVSGLVLIFVATALWGRKTTLIGPVTRSALALIFGGALGNLYDRVAYGTVTDFIEVYHGTWSFPAFNVADSAITVGAILLVIDLSRPRSKDIGQPAGLTQKQ